MGFSFGGGGSASNKAALGRGCFHVESCRWAQMSWARSSRPVTVMSASYQLPKLYVQRAHLAGQLAGGYDLRMRVTA